MVRIFLFVTLLSYALFGSNFKEEREGLDRFFIDPPFRIFYTLAGENKVNNRDINSNGIPDYIEDAMLHLKLADYIFKSVIGLHPPLQSERYKNISYIDVNVLKLKEEKHLGAAIDGVVQYKRPPGAKSTKVLSFDIRPDLDARGFTPIHELFHIYMNGYTMMKNQWLVEGLARVAQRAFGYYRLNYKGSPGLPKSNADKERLFKMSYDAFFFWNEVFYRTFGKTEIPDKDQILRAKYTDGSYILYDFSMHGYQFLPLFLEELQSIDLDIEKSRGLERYKWNKKEQLSSENNKFIWLGIKNIILKHRSKDTPLEPELKHLLLLD